MNVTARVLLLLAIMLGPLAARAGPVERRIAAVARAVDRAEPSDPAGRLKAVSDPLLGTPYGASPLGEEFAPDADPRVRFDAADCLTFVETALALTAARTMDDLRPLLDDIRYGDGRPSFDGRNHFVESQWIPRNVAKGWLRPASRDVAGPEVVRASKLFGPEQFARRFHPERLVLPDAVIPRGTFDLDVVPLAFAAAHPDAFRDGQLVLVVRTDAKRQPTRVTHVGFIVDTKAGRVLRHESRDPFMRVVDEPLVRFLARNGRYAEWPVVGLSAYDVLIPRQRVASVVARAAAMP